MSRISGQRAKNFYDEATFRQVIQDSGYEAAACYRLRGRELILLMGTPLLEATSWPIATTFSSDYTPAGWQGLPVGWFKPALGAEARKKWPKGLWFYYPVQVGKASQLIFGVQLKAKAKRPLPASLSALWEMIAVHILAFWEHNETCHFISESESLAQSRGLALNWQSVIDHEMRTPLTAVLGYSALLAEADAPKAAAEMASYAATITAAAEKALEAVEHLTTLLARGEQPLAYKASALERLELAGLCREVWRQVEAAALPLAKAYGREKALALRMEAPQGEELAMIGQRQGVKQALAEVLKNAVTYSGFGRVRLSLYRSESWVVIDIADDGIGVSPGAEELIFLRFFQEPLSPPRPYTRRGLGVGLYYARQMIEQHGGQLYFSRTQGRKGVFRFLLPHSVASPLPITEGAA